MVLGPKIRVPWEHPRTPAEYDENWRWLTRLFDQNDSTGTRWATKVVAPSDASSASLATADYICNGANDRTQLLKAINAVLGETGFGRVVILEGTLHFSSVLTITMPAAGMLVLEGMGAGTSDIGTRIIGPSGDRALKCVGAAGFTSTVALQNLYVAGTTHGVQYTACRAYIEDCAITSAGRSLDLDGGLSGPYAGSVVRNSTISSSDATGAARGILVQHEFGTMILDSQVSVAGTGRAICCFSDSGAQIRPTISNCRISSVLGQGIWLLDSTDVTNIHNAVIVGNYISGCAQGVYVTGGTDVAINGNHISTCGSGVEVGGGAGVTSNANVAVIGNYIHDCTIGVRVVASTLGTGAVGIVGNEFITCTTAGSIAASTGNNAFIWNDTYNCTTRLSDAGTSTRTEATVLTGLGLTLPTGGTIGQYLRKNSATNGDASWATLVDDVTSRILAKGDLLVGLAAGSVDRLGVDRDGQILMADSTQPTGAKWGPKVTINSTAPLSPRPGDIWIDVS